MKKLEEIRQTRNLFIEAEAPNDGMGGHYYDSISGKNLNFIFSYQMGWEHLSVSMPSRTPTWDMMCRMKDIFWNDDETCVEYHPAKNQYVNNHPHCLHIWRPVNNDQFFNEPESKEELLPVPPHLLVGFRDEEERKQFLQMADTFGVGVNKWDYNKRDRGDNNAL